MKRNRETGLLFAYGNVFKDGSRTSTTFKMELFATVGNGKVCNQWTIVFACYYSNSTLFTGKIKIGWKWSYLEGCIRCDFLFCRNVFTFFRKRQLLSVLLTFCFIQKINNKNENWYHCQFIFRGFINRSNHQSIHQHIFWKMLLIKCRKNSCEGVIFLKKLKIEINLL